MLSENLQATNWATDPLDTTNNPANPFQNEFQIRQSTGFVWFLTDNVNNSDIPTPTNTKFFPGSMGINGFANAVTTPMPLAYNSSKTPPIGGLAYSRPSATHPGGVQAIFCDSHLRFLNEEMAYHVYTQLMTPKQASVTLNAAGTATPGNTAGWNYVLSEADY